MGHVVQTNGDYTIKASSGGTIKLDTGTLTGTTLITGDLVVEGNTITVEAVNLNVEDNVITVNYGELGAGVTMLYSGLEVDRGTENNAVLLWDEAADSWFFANRVGLGDNFNYTSSNLRLHRITTDSDTDTGNLTLIDATIGVVNVGSSTDYYKRVLLPNDIPNKEYVDIAIQTQPARQIVSDTYNLATNPDATTSRVIVSDVKNGTDADTDFAGDQVAESEVAVIIDDVVNAKFFYDRIATQNLEIYKTDGNSTTIQAVNTDGDINLSTLRVGRVKTNYALQFEQIATTPEFPIGSLPSTLIHAKAQSAGATGLYFVNTSGTNGELISKNRALLFSMLF